MATGELCSQPKVKRRKPPQKLPLFEHSEDIHKLYQVHRQECFQTRPQNESTRTKHDRFQKNDAQPYFGRPIHSHDNQTLFSLCSGDFRGSQLHFSTHQTSTSSHPLCKRQNSVKSRLYRISLGESNRLLYLAFTYLLLSSLLLFNQALTAAACDASGCPDGCNCTSPSGQCFIDCSGKLGMPPPPSLFDSKAHLLDLSGNEFELIPDGYFDGFSNLEELYLHDNNLTYLPEEAISSLTNLKNITLYNNNWTCTCDLEWMKELINAPNEPTVNNHDQVLCGSPSALKGQPLGIVGLSTVKCASSYISCLQSSNRENDTVILWQYTNLETTISDQVRCKQECNSLGYTYAMIHSTEMICLCSTGEVPATVGMSCNSVCDGSSSTTSACGREIVRDEVLYTCIVPKFEGIRTYSQHEEVRLSVIPDFTVENSNFIWDFNDTTAVILTEKLVVTHKYALAGRYFVSVTVSCGNMFQVYNVPIIIEEPIKGVTLICDSVVEINENINAHVDVKHGTNPRLSWTSRRDGITTQDETFAQSEAHYLESKRTAYRVDILETKTTLEANAACVENKGHLAVVDSQEVTDFLMNVTDGLTDEAYWIGAVIANNLGGTLFQITEQTISGTMYTNWAEGEPNIDDDSLNSCVVFNRTDGGKWSLRNCQSDLPFICQYQSPDLAEEPRHYITGTAIFGSTTTSALKNLTEVTSSSIGLNQKLYTLLFPGLWLHHEGILGSWEFSGPTTPYNGTLKLQIYRATCADGSQKIRAGCTSLRNPFLTCGTADQYNDCIQKYAQCESGFQLCPITSNTCKSLSKPCSQFAEEDSSAVPTLSDQLGYTLVAERTVNAEVNKNEIYQLILQNDISLETDDIFGISFPLTASDVKDVDANDLPILCQSSNLSERLKANYLQWRQNALLVQTSSWISTGVSLDLSTKNWIESIWCDIRIHYSTESTGSKPTSSFLSVTESGNYTFSVMAFNNISQSDQSASSASCDVEVRNSVTNITIFAPKPTGFTAEGYPIISLPANTDKKIALEITGGEDTGVEIVWENMPTGFIKTAVEHSCPSDIDVPECGTRSFLRITTADVNFPNDTTVIKATARNAYSSAQISIRVVADEQIKGLRILPNSISRVLASIPQVFSAEVDTGGDVTYSWIIDSLTQFTYTGQQYNVLFRTPAEYELTVVAENSVGSVNTSKTLLVDEMNVLTGLTFLEVPSPFIMQTNSLVELKTEFFVDINIDYQVEWTINNVVTSGPVISQPHTGTADSSPDIERVRQTSTANDTFPTTGQKEIQVRVYNDYDSISTTINVDIRAALTAVSVQMTSDVPAVGDDLEFRVTGTPSTYGAVFTYDWGDGNTDTESDLATITHRYTSPGTYTINMTADNKINVLSNTTTITIYERITGLDLTSNAPTELTLPTKFTASVQTGSASALYSFHFNESSIADLVNVTDLIQTVTYPATGTYTASVTAANLISSQTFVLEVRIFEMRITEVNTTKPCFETNTNATIQAFATTDAAGLFEYKWTFEDGTVRNADGVHTLDYKFTSAGQHNVTVKVTSKNTSLSDTMSTIVCVQDAVSSASVTDAPPTALGSMTTFALLSVGGTDPEYSIDFGDGTGIATATLPNTDYTYSAIGNYTVIFIAENLVSQVNATAYLPVQEAVAGVNITTTSTYSPMIAKDLSVTYTATTTAGSNLEYVWDFNDGSAQQTGNDVSHIYATTGTYTIGVTVSNLISTESFNLDVTVMEPVAGVSITRPSSVVKANTSVTFTASITNGGPGEQYYWKVTPGQDYTLGTASFTYTFPAIFNYSVAVKVENQVSADYAEIFVLSADPIDGVNISTSALVNDKYVARNESTRLEAVLITGENVTTTTAGSESVVLSDWTISIGGVVEKTYNDSPTIFHSFEQVGVYIVSVNISNGVSTKQTQIEVTCMDRVGDISFQVINGFDGAAALNNEVKIMAIASLGTDLEFYWDPNDSSTYLEVNNENLTHTYTVVDTFYPFVTVGNVLGNKTESYEVIVQEEITGLAISHLNAIVPFYVPHLQRTNFAASIDAGTSATYAWYYVDQTGRWSDIENSTNTQMNWKFPEVTTYTLVVNASNLVSWDQVNYTVIVVRPIVNLDIVSDSFIVATNTSILLNGTVASGDDVIFKISIDNVEMNSTAVDEHNAYLSHSFLAAGTYEIYVQGDNNVSTSNITKTISVRDIISGVQIGGCCVNESYVATGDNLTFTASIVGGTDVTYEWEITYASSAVVQGNGAEISRVLSEPGRTEIKLKAGNVISEQITRIYLLLQDRVRISLSVDDPGRTLYTNENITLRISVVGTNVTNSIIWGEVIETPEVTTNNVSVHIYRLKGTYTIRVNASNEVSWDEETTSVTIMKLQCVAPTISFVQTGASSKFFRSRTIYVESTLTTNCSAYEVAYRWIVYRQDDCTTLDANNQVPLITVNTNKPMLVLPALTLEVNSYCFEVEVSYTDTYLSDTSAVKVAVLSTPLTVVIIGGTTRFLSQGVPLVLDASRSFDPDVPTAASTGISYLWNCNATAALADAEYGYLPTPQKDSGCTIPAASQTSALVEIAAGTLDEHVQYNYMVQGSKSGKTPTTAIQRVIVVNRTIPTTTVICYSCYKMASYRVSASFHVGLQGSCDSCSATDNIEYIWEVTKVETDGSLTEFPISLDTTTTGSNSPYLVVKEGALENAHSYQFKLRIKVDGKEGYSKLELEPNVPPVNGSCDITYDESGGSSIYVLETLVNFSCSNWQDDAGDGDSPLVYTIIACRNANTDTEDLEDAFILYRGTREITETFIPLGHEEYGGQVNIKILVEDQLGTSTLAFDRNVTVVLGEASLDWLLQKVDTDLMQLRRLNDPQSILDFSASAITILNSISDEAVAVTSTEFNRSVAVREKIIETVSEISMATLKDVQQVASVLEQCVKVPAEVQNPTMTTLIISSLDSMVERLHEFVNKEGQSTFQRATNDVLDIIGGLLRVVNYAIYDSAAVNEIVTVTANASQNLDESYRQATIEKLLGDVNSIVTNLLTSKVVDEEAVSFLSPVVTLTTMKTTPSTVQKQQVNGGVLWILPDHIFDNFDPNMELLTVSMVYEQNPFTYGFPPHSLAAFANVTSRVPTIEFMDANGTALNISNLASPTDGNDKRVKLAMTQSTWECLSDEDTLAVVNSSGSLYQPRNGLTFETAMVQPLQSLGITLTNNNRDSNTAVHIMITYTKKYNNNKGEPNPAIEAYFDYSTNPNMVNNTASMRITDDSMADGADHQQYTLFLQPGVHNTTAPELYLNISNYFTYEILDIEIAVYYIMCLYYENTSDVWASDGLYVSPESTYTVTVCYSDHLTSFGSFVINPPNLVNVTDIVNIDFFQNPIALITIVVIMFLYIVAMIWARRLDLRDIKRASLIPLCGSNGSFKYEITIKTAAGIGSGTTANVGICVYGCDQRSGSRHLARKDAFQRGAVDTMQIATDVSLGEIFKIKIWHDNTGLDPGWCIDRVMVRDLQNETKYYFLVNSWLQVYPDDEDETCLEKTILVATEEELMNFSNIFGSQLSYGWEDAHLWLSVIERPTRSRFTRVQRVTCCVTLLLAFMLFSAFWYQGYDADGDVIPQDTLVGIVRWKDIAVGAIVSLMVFPISILIVCVFKKSKSKVAPVKPWLERSRTAQTIEILDEILDSGGRRYPGDISDSDDDDYDQDSTKHRGLLPGHSEFLAEFANENKDSHQTRSQTPASIKSKMYETPSSQRSRLHKGSGTVKSLDIKSKVVSNVWSDDSGIQLSDSPSTSGVTGSSGDIGVSSEERSSTSESPEWPNRTSATKKGLLHFQDDLEKPEKFSSTSFVDSPSQKKKPLRRKNTGYVRRNTDSASPPNFIPDDEDSDGLWDVFDNDDDIGDDLVITNKQAVLRRTRGAKFGDDDEIALVDEKRGLVLDDVDLESDDGSDDDVALPDFLGSRSQSRASAASTHFGTSPQPSSERYLLPHWCIYLNYFICFATMGTCMFFIILYGNEFGADTTKRWLLSMFVALLESFFLIEPIKVVLFAVFLALITKPINPEESDNLVDEPLVETYGHTDSFSKVRAPGGFALDKCKREASKTKRSNKLMMNLAIYLIFISSVAAVASWDRDTMGYYNTLAVKESLFSSNFTLPSDSEGPRWQNESATFYQIRTVTDIWAWLDQVFCVKIYEDKSALENENLNNNLLGKIRLRQQRSLRTNCVVDDANLQYNQLTYSGQECLTNSASSQQTGTYGPGWTNNSSTTSWEFTGPEFGGVKYWGENMIYDDSGYSEYLDSSASVASVQANISDLFTQNWVNRDTQVLFVEFTQINPATYWFTVTVIMFEMGVSGAVRPSYDIQTVRIIVPSSSFYVDMLFMVFVGIIGILLLLSECKKATDRKITAQIYFSKWTNWVNLLVLLLTTSLCVLYIYKEVYMEEVTQKYISDKTAFTNFYKIAFYTDLVTINACLLLFALIVRATRLFRFIKSWSSFGETMVASAGHLLGAALMLIIFIMGFAALGFLIYGQSYTQIIPDFQDYPNALYSMFRAFRGRLDVQICFDYSPFFTIFFFFSFYFGIFYIFCRIFAAILINEYKFTKGRKSHLRTDVPDYEILRHLIARIKMRLGLIKPKQYRPMVRFEGMSTPSSRGSFMSFDSFDSFSFIPGRISQCSYATGISSSSSDSGFGTPSDHSLSVYDYLTLDQPSDTPMDAQHLDYLYGRLSNYSVDMMLHRFERVSVLTDEVGEMEENAVKVSILAQQRAMLRSQSKEIALAASTVTVQPNFIPETENTRSEGSATTYSSRGHFSLHSQPTLSLASQNSGRKSAISSDSIFQTVMNSMFPLKQSWVSDFSQTELESVKRVPVAPTKPKSKPLQKIHPPKRGLRGTSSASAVLRREGSNVTNSKFGTVVNATTGKRRPHSDEGARVKNDKTNTQENSLNDLNLRRRPIITAFRATPPPEGRPKT